LCASFVYTHVDEVVGVVRIIRAPLQRFHGTKCLHCYLFLVLNYRLSAGSGAAGNSSINMTGCNVWYHYDTTPENLADCKA
jgi:hypothetical protein